jgi:hypothetical protein
MHPPFVTEFLARCDLRGFESSNIYDDRAALWQFENVLDEEELDQSGGGGETAARGFTLFPQLAVELREMIWWVSSLAGLLENVLWGLTVSGEIPEMGRL